MGQPHHHKQAHDLAKYAPKGHFNHLGNQSVLTSAPLGRGLILLRAIRQPNRQRTGVNPFSVLPDDVWYTKCAVQLSKCIGCPGWRRI